MVVSFTRWIEQTKSILSQNKAIFTKWVLFVCLQSADKKTKASLNELHVTCKTPEKTYSCSSTPRSYSLSPEEKGKKETLVHKRDLASALGEKGCKEVGLSSRLSQAPPPYQSKGSKLQPTITEFFNEQAVENPCKAASGRKQLTKSVKRLHNTLKRKGVEISLRSLHRHKPKNIVTKLKFRQCLCEICVNPKTKVGRLNALLPKDEEVSQKGLISASVHVHEGEYANISCVERKCGEWV
ncbi:hypothetical protein BaRGS_00015075 [Batillaria attramentaria]|uniref:Recombination activating protein 1 n=1 Tax=Batillaria attramentaria TaxID=370345 RepID=A0ABD0L3C4_9CAEN